MVGPEQVDPRRFGNVPRDQRTYVNSHLRYVLDFVFQYTGFDLTLALNMDYGHEQADPFLRSLDARQNNDSTWWGWAVYGAYDWTEKLRTAVRQEPFRDAQAGAPGSGRRRGSGRPPRRCSTRSGGGCRGGSSIGTIRPTTRCPVRCSRPDITWQGLLARGQSMDTFSISLIYSFF